MPFSFSADGWGDFADSFSGGSSGGGTSGMTGGTTSFGTGFGDFGGSIGGPVGSVSSPTSGMTGPSFGGGHTSGWGDDGGGYSTSFNTSPSWGGSTYGGYNDPWGGDDGGSSYSASRSGQADMAFAGMPSMAMSPPPPPPPPPPAIPSAFAGAFGTPGGMDYAAFNPGMAPEMQMPGQPAESMSMMAMPSPALNYGTYDPPQAFDPGMMAALGRSMQAVDERDDLMFNPEPVGQVAFDMMPATFDQAMFNPASMIDAAPDLQGAPMFGIPAQNVETEFARGINIGDRELDQLGRISRAEAEIDGRPGMHGAGRAVLNRVAANEFPNTIRSVVEQRPGSEFEPMGGRTSIYQLPAATPQQIGALREDLSLADPTRGATFFLNAPISDRRGTNFGGGRTPTAQIGRHTFHDGWGNRPAVDVPQFTPVVTAGLDRFTRDTPTGSQFANLQETVSPSATMVAGIPTPPSRPSDLPAASSVPVDFFAGAPDRADLAADPTAGMLAPDLMGTTARGLTPGVLAAGTRDLDMAALGMDRMQSLSGQPAPQFNAFESPMDMAPQTWAPSTGMFGDLPDEFGAGPSIDDLADFLGPAVLGDPMSGAPPAPGGGGTGNIANDLAMLNAPMGARSIYGEPIGPPTVFGARDPGVDYSPFAEMPPEFAPPAAAPVDLGYGNPTAPLSLDPYSGMRAGMDYQPSLRGADQFAAGPGQFGLTGIEPTAAPQNVAAVQRDGYFEPAPMVSADALGMPGEFGPASTLVDFQPTPDIDMATPADLFDIPAAPGMSDLPPGDRVAGGIDARTAYDAPIGPSAFDPTAPQPPSREAATAAREAAQRAVDVVERDPQNPQAVEVAARELGITRDTPVPVVERGEAKKLPFAEAVAKFGITTIASTIAGLATGNPLIGLGAGLLTRQFLNSREWTPGTPTMADDDGGGEDPIRRLPQYTQAPAPAPAPSPPPPPPATGALAGFRRRYLGAGDDLTRYGIAGPERDYYEPEPIEMAEGGLVRDTFGPTREDDMRAARDYLASVERPEPPPERRGALSVAFGAARDMFSPGGMMNPTGPVVEPSAEGLMDASQFGAEMLTPGPGIEEGMRQIGEARESFREGDYLDAFGQGVSGIVQAGADIPQLSIFAGPTARTANRAMLRQAQELDSIGADRREIWDATGWFRGPDDQWRFEINDRTAMIKGGDPIVDIAARRGNTFDDVMRHPELFEAYPAINRTNVRDLGDGGSADAAFERGMFGPDTIHFGSSISGKSVPLHELQHGVQAREGFARGGNPRGNVRAIRDEADQQLGFINDRLRNIVRAKRSAEEAGDVIGVRNADVEYRRTMQQKEEILETAAADPMDIYRRLAGEVEARNVQTRMDMTPDQRRATPPWETQDVPDDFQIVRRGGDGPQMSVRSADEILDLPGDEMVTLYHGTTREGAENIRKTGRLQSAGEPDVYLTTDPRGGDYGDGSVVPVRVPRRLLNLDDEFPDGRADFRVSVRRPGGSIPIELAD